MNTYRNQSSDKSFEPSSVLTDKQRAVILNLYRERVAIKFALETNIDGIDCQEWVCPDACDICCDEIDPCCLPAQVKEHLSDRRDSERRDYVYGTITVDVPYKLKVTEAMVVEWRDKRYKIIAVVNDLDIATRIRASFRIE